MWWKRTVKYLCLSGWHSAEVITAGNPNVTPDDLQVGPPHTNTKQRPVTRRCHAAQQSQQTQPTGNVSVVPTFPVNTSADWCSVITDAWWLVFHVGSAWSTPVGLQSKLQFPPLELSSVVYLFVVMGSLRVSGWLSGGNGEVICSCEQN